MHALANRLLQTLFASRGPFASVVGSQQAVALVSGVRVLPAMASYRSNSVPAHACELGHTPGDQRAAPVVGRGGADSNHGSGASVAAAAPPPLLASPAGPPETARRRTTVTFYKRTLPCPPAVAFSSSEGARHRRQAWLRHQEGQRCRAWQCQCEGLQSREL